MVRASGAWEGVPSDDAHPSGRVGASVEAEEERLSPASLPLLYETRWRDPSPLHPGVLDVPRAEGGDDEKPSGEAEPSG